MNLFLSDTDKRVFVIAIIIAIVLFLVLGLIGVAVRHTMMAQAKRADSMMYDVAKTHVVNSTQDFRRLGLKKNNRAFFKDSIPPFLIALTGVVVYLIANLATGEWGRNPFVTFGELFVSFDWEEEGLFVEVFGITLLSHWPSVLHEPTFVWAHAAEYLEVILWLVAGVYYLYCSQAYISRAFMIHSRSVKVYEKSLAGYNANEDVVSKLDIKADKPVLPSD